MPPLPWAVARPSFHSSCSCSFTQQIESAFVLRRPPTSARVSCACATPPPQKTKYDPACLPPPGECQNQRDFVMDRPRLWRVPWDPLGRTAQGVGDDCNVGRRQCRESFLRHARGPEAAPTAETVDTRPCPRPSQQTREVLCMVPPPLPKQNYTLSPNLERRLWRFHQRGSTVQRHAPLSPVGPSEPDRPSLSPTPRHRSCPPSCAPRGRLTSAPTHPCCHFDDCRNR